MAHMLWSISGVELAAAQASLVSVCVCRTFVVERVFVSAGVYLWLSHRYRRRLQTRVRIRQLRQHLRAEQHKHRWGGPQWSGHAAEQVRRTFCACGVVVRSCSTLVPLSVILAVSGGISHSCCSPPPVCGLSAQFCWNNGPGFALQRRVCVANGTIVPFQAKSCGRRCPL